MPNVELKAHVDDPAATLTRVLATGAELTVDHVETDTYFNVQAGRLKYRESSDPKRAPRLIAYHRSDKSEARRSDFQLAEVEPGSTVLKDLLTETHGVRATTSKRRRRFQFGQWLINLDTVDPGHHFVEIEVRYDDPGEEAAARRLAGKLQEQLGIRPEYIARHSYEQLQTILRRSDEWREKLGAALGRLILLDGPSCSGKSTLAAAVTQSESSGVAYVPRVTTRDRRPDDVPGEYVYITGEEHRALESDGAFLESRDFLFGMSYGLAWRDVAERLATGEPVLGLVNLGNIRHIREVAPEAATVLVIADEATLRRRLQARGVHKPEAVEERIENARMAQASRDLYDVVIDNEDGLFQQSVGKLAQICDQVRRSSSV